MEISTKTTPLKKKRNTSKARIRVYEQGVSFSLGAINLLGLDADNPENNPRFVFDIMGKSGKMVMDQKKGFQPSFKKPGTFMIYGRYILQMFCTATGKKTKWMIFDIGDFSDGGWTLVLRDIGPEV